MKGSTANIRDGTHSGLKVARKGATMAPILELDELKEKPMFLIGVGYSSTTNK